jgi:hypothetical protein
MIFKEWPSEPERRSRASPVDGLYYWSTEELRVMTHTCARERRAHRGDRGRANVLALLAHHVFGTALKSPHDGLHSRRPRDAEMWDTAPLPILGSL